LQSIFLNVPRQGVRRALVEWEHFQSTRAEGQAAWEQFKQADYLDTLVEFNAYAKCLFMCVLPAFVKIFFAAHSTCRSSWSAGFGQSMVLASDTSLCKTAACLVFSRFYEVTMK
jgi:hypothetical protein